MWIASSGMIRDEMECVPLKDTPVLGYTGTSHRSAPCFDCVTIFANAAIPRQDV